MEKQALFVLDDEILAELFKTIFNRVDYKVTVVETTKDAIEEIIKSTYSIILIGSNKGSVVKNKLADILYDKAFGFKPHIIIIKEPGDIIYKSDHITFIRRPSFHQELLKSLSIIDENKKIKQMLDGDNTVNIAENFIKNKNFKPYKPINFFKHIKGNKKFEILHNNDKIIGFLINNEIHILLSDLENPYSLLSFDNIDVAIEDFEIAEFLSLKTDDKLFKQSFREFLLKSLERINDENKLLSFLGSSDKVISIKAPRYILQQCRIIDANFNLDWLESQNKKITIREIVERYPNDISKLKTIVAMYLLNMIELLDVHIHTDDIAPKEEKFDVDIKKSLLQKIMDKIRGL